jgi:hypothetical protein
MDFKWSTIRAPNFHKSDPQNKLRRKKFEAKKWEEEIEKEGESE